MLDHKSMSLLEKQPVSLRAGWDSHILAYCRSTPLDGFGRGVVQSIGETKKDADANGVPFTAWHIVSILMQTVQSLMEDQQPLEHVILAMRLCPRLLPLLIENPLTVNDAATFLHQENAEILRRLDKW
jgi:hypothetical protein